MKDLLSNENYCYKIHTIFINENQCLQVNLDPSTFMTFQKSQPPINKGGGEFTL